MFCWTFWSVRQQNSSIREKRLMLQGQVSRLYTGRRRVPSTRFPSPRVSNGGSSQNTGKGLLFQRSLKQKPDSYFCSVQNLFGRIHTNDINLREITLLPTIHNSIKNVLKPVKVRILKSSTRAISFHFILWVLLKYLPACFGGIYKK